MTETRRERLFLGIIFLVVFITRLLLLINTDDFHGVSAGKVLLSELIIRNNLNPGEWFVPVHPPVHILLLTMALRICHNPLVVPRIISLLFGSFLVFPFFYSIKSLFDRRTAIFSTIAVGFYSMHIVYSVIATAATMFQFFLFSAFWFCLKYRQNKTPGFLYGAGLMLSIASLCRYEGLLFIPLIVFFFRAEGKKLFLFSVFALSLPALWAVLNLQWGSDPLLFLHTNDFTVPLQFNWIRGKGFFLDRVYKVLFWPKILIQTIGWPMFVLGIAGMGFCLNRKKTRAAAFMIWILWGIFILRTVQERLYLQPRYSITLGLFMIPFAIYMLYWIFDRFPRKVPAWLVLVAIWSMIPAISNAIQTEPLYVPLFAQKVASYLKEGVSETDNIIVDHCGDEKYRDPIKVMSGINPKQFILTPYLVIRDGLWLSDKDMFFNVLDRYAISMIVYSPKGDLGSILELEKNGKISSIRGFSFELLYEYYPYMVYRVRKEDDAA